jgi:hypothetical protein
MTPKEKAQELVNKFNEYTVKAIKYFANGKIKECKEDAKECALIAVEQLIEQENRYNNGSFYPSKYWIEVKQEIEKL